VVAVQVVVLTVLRLQVEVLPLLGLEVLPVVRVVLVLGALLFPCLVVAAVAEEGFVLFMPIRSTTRVPFEQTEVQAEMAGRELALLVVMVAAVAVAWLWFIIEIL
jgi:hypothetical protein